MNYSVVFYFDDEANKKVKSLIHLIVDKGVNDYLISNKVPPHITIADFECEDISAVINSLEVNKNKIKQGFVCWASIGVFSPTVLFLAPVVNQFLLQSCEMVNNSIQVVPKVESNSNYVPYQWIPHTTIAAKLNSKELETAFLVATDNFKAFGGYLTKLAVIQNKPRTDIKVWNLQEIGK